MKVLHVGKFYPPARGGMERVVQLLCEGERAHIDSSVLAANDRPVTVRDEVHGVPVTRAATLTTIGSVGVCPSFPLWMRRLPADVMVIHEPNPLALVAHAIARPRARLVLWFHSEVVRPQWKYRVMYRPFLRRVLRLADRIVVASPRLAEFAEELKDFRHKCVPIPFGLDLTPLDLTDEVERKVADIYAQHASPLALFVGRMVPYKGVDILLHALTDVDARLVLVGDGPERAAWQQLAVDLGLQDRVHFLGEVVQTDLTALYHACDFFVLPSVTRAEAFGMVQLEAMACGKPVISTLLPTGVPWVNRDGETGLVVQPQNVPALRAALARLARDAALRAEMGAQGRARVLAHFTVPRMIERTTTLYTSILAEPVASRRAALADPAAGMR
ncbi:MAG: glycosyltransferase [Acidobacteria bacterium]|nr:MAG: glycosyltransferase [Acidobacteriota bacterium]PYR51964.1 MAG: glycosyltransferase [Acidobacteriota bacterium]